MTKHPLSPAAGALVRDGVERSARKSGKTTTGVIAVTEAEWDVLEELISEALNTAFDAATTRYGSPQYKASTVAREAMWRKFFGLKYGRPEHLQTQDGGRA